MASIIIVAMKPIIWQLGDIPRLWKISLSDLVCKRN